MWDRGNRLHEPIKAAIPLATTPLLVLEAP